MINFQSNSNSQLLKNPDIEPKTETERIVGFIRNTVKKAEFEKVVVAVSGGVDSGTVLALCVMALGKKNVIAIKLPFGELNRKASGDANLIIRKFDLPKENIVEIDIKSVVDLIKTQNKNFSTNQNREIYSKKDLIRHGNLMARTRMIYLYDLAKKEQTLVVGTENKSEYLLGYFTRFGDEASDLEPVRHLYKTEIRKLAKHLGVPKKVIDKEPTAGLWEGQSDEQELGFSYEEADAVLFLRFEKKLEWREIELKITNNELDIRKEVLIRIRERVEKNHFKHLVPYSLNS